jgi:hypothetical protein
MVLESAFLLAHESLDEHVLQWGVTQAA